MLLNKNLDFAKGQKTVTGVAVFLIPTIAAQFGIDIPANTVADTIAQGFELSGSILATYGLLMKFVRFVDSHVVALFKN